MTNLIASNSVTRRYLKRGELMAKRRAESAQNETHKAECKSHVDRAISLCSLRDKPEQESTGSMCLPEVALFAAGHRRSKQVTAR
ncbi:hypothetical protein DTA24_07700 [Klebsiella sp. P1CD1]|uniref:transcriptional antitermination N peptide n=1 Tax=Klebsiella sp. P1CD1 TaxID=2267618 RepID=UPI000F50000D|nr:hypothetical protein [Klebsiella sp. P1CD1]AYW18541.1 hypothetical protein DTA24_07700 [Klebsiella sp. P1CD1]